jgi:hypothetical protein
MPAPTGATGQAEAAQFFLLPHRHLHDTWRAEMLPDPVWRVLADCPRTEGRLAAFVTERAGFDALPSSLALDTPKARFCLVPWAALGNVALRLGLALNAMRFSRMIDGKLVARLRRELGSDALEFALHRGPLITQDTDPLAPDLESDGRPAELLERSGINYFGLALADLDSHLRERFKLRLPNQYAPLLAAPSGSVSPKAAWKAVRKVVREAEPEWSGLLE